MSRASGPVSPSCVPRPPFAGVALVLAWLLAFGPPAAAATGGPNAAATTREVLVLYPYGRQVQPTPEGGRRSIDGYGFGGLAEEFAARPDVPVIASSEFLDKTRFGGPDHQRAFASYLRDKYGRQPPEVVIVVSEAALAFALRYRAELFPQVPIVHLGVDSTALRSLEPLPPDVVGTPVNYDFVRTVEQARRWHPGARRLVVVTGANSWDRQWEARLRAEAGRLPAGLAVDFLAGLPVEEMERRLRRLPADSIVYTPGFFRDGAGSPFEPRQSVRRIVAASPAPVYAPLATYLGTGVVGGYMASYETMGRIGAATALAILDGAAPSTLKPPATLPTPLQVDWRQLRRFGIPDSAVPAGAIVQFREPALWEAHRDWVIVGAAVMLLQAALIVALLLERRRRRRTVAALARSEEHMRLAAGAAGLSTWVLDDDVAATGRASAPRRANPAHAAVVDFRETLARVVPQDRATLAAALHAARVTGGEFEVEYRIEAPDGGWRWQSARGRADRATPTRLLGVAIDVTQRKRAEIQADQDRVALHHMTRVSLLGQLSASIAHQLNQPLASILGNAEAAQQMLEREPVDLPELREICADIVAENHRAAQVIRRLVALFRRGERLFEPLDVNDLVRDTLELTRSMLTMRHVAVATQLAPDLPPVSGDRVQLQQLLLNLIVNASDAMAESPEDRRELTIRTASDEGAVHLCVADRGPGVPPEAIDKVFEPFWSTRPDGMGMGLAVCRSIAEAHHGSLAVANVAGGGAEFRARLPARAAP